MKLQLSPSGDQYQITGHGPGHVLVNGVRHESSLIVLPDEIVTPWVGCFADLSVQAFDLIRVRAPEIVLLGSGARAFECVATFRFFAPRPSRPSKSQNACSLKCETS